MPSHLFLAYLQGIETGIGTVSLQVVSLFLAYLQGIETMLSSLNKSSGTCF